MKFQKNKYTKKAVEIGSIINDEIFKFRKNYEFKNKNNIKILVLGGSQAAKSFGEKLPQIFEECKKFNVVVNTITPGTPIKTSMSKKTYSKEKKEIWRDPEVISPAFLHLGLQNKNGINNKYINAWNLSKKVKKNYIIK